MQMPPPTGLTERHRYKRILPPLHFPEEEQVTEGELHLEVRLLLRAVLKLELEGRATVGSDQFVYWNARDPQRCLAPDVFVRLAAVVHDLRTWKTWEHGGVPELGVEISSPSDTPEGPWQDKLERYAELGVRELVRFGREPPRLQIWDRVDENLLEREVGDRAEWSEVLGLWWVTVSHPDLGPTLRLARDPAGQDLLPTPLENARRAHAEERRAHAEERRAHAEERRAREAAEERIRELEAELRRRGG